MSVEPDRIVKVSNDVAKMLDGLLKPAGISFAIVICNDDPNGSFAHWISNTTKADACKLFIAAIQHIEDRE